MPINNLFIINKIALSLVKNIFNSTFLTIINSHFYEVTHFIKRLKVKYHQKILILNVKN